MRLLEALQVCGGQALISMLSTCNRHCCTAQPYPACPAPPHLWHLLQAQQPGLVCVAQRPLQEGVGGAVDALQQGEVWNRVHGMLEAWQEGTGAATGKLASTIRTGPRCAGCAQLWCAVPHLVDAQDDGRPLVAACRAVVHQAHVVGGAGGVLEVPGLDGRRAVAARLRTAVPWEQIISRCARHAESDGASKQETVQGSSQAW